MRKYTKESKRMTIGIDLGDLNSQVCVLDPEGETAETLRVRTTKEGLTSQFKKRAPARIAMEAGTHSAWVSRLLKGFGHEVLIANPRKLRLIYENHNKSDEVDAEYLARLARLDPKLLAPIDHRDAETQAALAVLRSRNALVEARTKLINQVRGTLKALGYRLPAMSTEAFAGKAIKDIPEELYPAAEPLIEVIDTITKQIRRQNKFVENMAEELYPETQKLREIDGVGALTAVAYRLTIGDPKRFRKSRTVGAFVGLVPRQQQSGKQDPQLRITKAGDNYLRKLLVGSAHYILGPFGPDCDMRRFGEKLTKRGGKNAKKRAIVAVARKLSVLMHRLLISGEPYEPLRKIGKKKRCGTPSTAPVRSLRSR